MIKPVNLRKTKKNVPFKIFLFFQEKKSAMLYQLAKVLSYRRPLQCISLNSK